jgi:hypothetical protein
MNKWRACMKPDMNIMPQRSPHRYTVYVAYLSWKENEAYEIILLSICVSPPPLFFSFLCRPVEERRFMRLPCCLCVNVSPLTSCFVSREIWRLVLPRTSCLKCKSNWPVRECIRERMHILHVFMCPNQYVICVPACVPCMYVCKYIWLLLVCVLVRMFIYTDMSRKTRADSYCDFEERNEGSKAKTNAMSTDVLLGHAVA